MAADLSDRDDRRGDVKNVVDLGGPRIPDQVEPLVDALGIPRSPSPVWSWARDRTGVSGLVEAVSEP